MAMKNNLQTTRRQLLRMGFRTASTIGAAAAFGHLGRVNAWAQSGTDYKALVCVFLFGGHDANNMVVPLSTTGYQQYQSVRQGLALAANTLLPVNTAQNEAYGLHPSLQPLQALYTTSKDLALVANVGMLVRPVTRDEYLQRSKPVPSNLFSHSDQTAQWQNAAPLGGVTTGWSGRIADKLGALNYPSQFPVSIGVSGNALQLVGQTTVPTSIQNSTFGLEGSDGSAVANARDHALEQILAMSSGAVLVQAANQVLTDALKVAKLVDEASTSAPPLNTAFPNTGLGQQLLQVARIIQIRAQLGMKRQIFFCSLGGFDTHSGQLGTQAALLTELAQAMAAFYNATGEMGVQNGVVTFTESEFSRTFQPNGTAGTDHAWGGHTLVLGGPVNGGNMYGKFPSLVLGGVDDSGNRGNWIPGVALDQYGATLATWFGVQPGDLQYVFPNVNNFSSPAVGFL
ncbi:MAG: DUF1501 domain-containing protein [Bryobacteraceae bacterium]